MLLLCVVSVSESSMDAVPEPSLGLESSLWVLPLALHWAVGGNGGI